MSYISRTIKKRPSPVLCLIVLCIWSLLTVAQQMQQDNEYRDLRLTEWGKQRNRPQSPSALAQKERPSSVHIVRKPMPKGQVSAPDAEVGVSIWRLRPSNSSDEVKDLIQPKPGGRKEEWTPERVESETILSPGSLVRLSIESLRKGYLYVINRAKYTDGTSGIPYLIFPTARINGGENAVIPGLVTQIPNPKDDPPYFALEATRSEQGAKEESEELIILITKEPLTTIRPGADRIRLSKEKVEQLIRLYGNAPFERSEMKDGAGKAITRKESEAAKDQSLLLTPDDLYPQTIYRVAAKAGDPLLVTVRLQVAEKNKITQKAPEKREPASINQPQLVVQLGHTKTVRCLAFSRDNRFLLTGSNDGTALLWDMTTGREVQRFAGGASKAIASVALSQDNRLVTTREDDPYIAGDDSTMRLWDVATGQEVWNVKEQTDYPHQIVFTPNGRFVVAEDRWKTVRFLDTKTGRIARSFKLNSEGGVALSPDARYALTGIKNGAQFWDMTTGQITQRFKSSSTEILFTALSSDAKFVMVVSAADQNMEFWETTTGQKISQWSLEKEEDISSLIPSPGNRLVAMVKRGSVYLLEMATGKEVRRFDGHSVTSITFSSDGNLMATGSENGTARVWNVGTNQEAQRWQFEKPKGAWNFNFSSDGRLAVAGGEDNVTRLWDTTTGKELKRFVGGKDFTAISPDNRFVITSSEDGTSRIWNAVSGQEQGRLDIWERPIAFSPDSRVVTATRGGVAYLRDTATGKEIRHFGGDTTPESVALSPDSNLVITGNRDGSVWLRDLATKQVKYRFERPPGAMGPIVLSSDNKLAVAKTIGATAILWDLTTGRELQRLEGHSIGVASVAFSTDTRLVATGGWDQTARIWDAATGKELQFLGGHTEGVVFVAFLSDNRLLMTMSADGTARFWDTLSGKEQRRWRQENFTKVTSAVLSTDGRMLAILGQNNVVSILNASTGKELQRIVAKSFLVDSVATSYLAFSSNNRFLLTGDSDNAVRLWDSATGEQVWRGAISTVFSTVHVTSIAFSPNGSLVAAGGSDGSLHILDAIKGEEVLSFDNEPYKITSAAISSDNRLLVTGSPKGSRLWDITTGRELRRFEGGEKFIAISPDGHFILTEGREGYVLEKQKSSTAWLWSVATGKLIAQFKASADGYGDSINCAAFSPDSHFAATGDSKGVMQIWDVMTGQEAQSLGGHSRDLRSVSFSPDGQHVVTVNWAGAVWRHSIARESEIRRFEGSVIPVDAAAFSLDDRQIITRGSGIEFLWDNTTGQVTRGPWKYNTDARKKPRFEGKLPVAISSDGRLLVTISKVGPDDGGYGLAIVWDSETASQEDARLLLHSDRPGSMNCAAFSPDGRLVATGGSDGTARIWALSEAIEANNIFEHQDGVHGIAFSPDGRTILTGSRDIEASTRKTLLSGQVITEPKIISIARLWDVKTGREVRRFVRPADNKNLAIISTIAFSPDGRSVVMGGDGSVPGLWDVATGKQIQQFLGHGDTVHSLSFSPDGRFVLTGSKDLTTRVWEAATGKELCRLIAFKDDDWIVVTSDGRFDTTNLEDATGARWIMPDDPFKPIPLVTFARDYYEPRLLPRILAGEKFKPIRNISELNRVFPDVKITKIILDSTDTVSVSVEVSRAKGEFLQGAGKVVKETGVYDVRLFRDGQLVGYAPETKSEIGEIKVDANTGKAMLTFSNIKLPHKQDVTQVEFSAYAFNVDRLKSATDRKTYELPKNLTPVRGRAYLVTVGVNANEQPYLALRFAANDARRIQSVLSERLAQRGEYAEIIQVPLISDYVEQANEKKIAENRATKANVKAVLDLLAGRQVAPEVLKDIPNADKLRQAKPEDFFLIAFSSHGHADADGNFYLVPYDTGQVKVLSAEFLQHCISSQELSLWLRDVDAGEMTMIVDACHSSSAVEGADFKPAPMGSRGLGQVSYDKGMRILTATQANNVALGSGKLEQGLLTYALVRDGIEEGAADFKPKDNTIMLSEWLAYGVERVPMLYEEIKSGELREVVHGNAGKAGQTLKVQYPGLFDFARKRRDVILIKKE